MQNTELIIRNARLRNDRTRHDRATDDREQPVDIAISNGRISPIGPRLQDAASEEIDARGNLVTPSLVNPHMHLCKV